MLKSRLYWKVLGNFAILLMLITAMTFLTTGILGEIQTNFTLSLDDIKLLNNTERLRRSLADVPNAANEYVLTGDVESHDLYNNSLIEFDIAIENLRRAVVDTSVSNSVQKIRSLFYQWKEKIGDAKIELGDRRRRGQEVEAELRSVNLQETQVHFVAEARNLLRNLFRGKIYSQSHQIEVASELVNQLTWFIVLVNILLAAFSVALGFILTRSITKPVRLLTEGTQKIMAGKFESISLNRSDELGQLAGDFSQMSSMLGSNYARLNAYSELVTALNTYATNEEVGAKSLQLICKNTESSVGALYILDKKENVLKLSAGYGLSTRAALAKRYALGEGIPGECALQRRTLEVMDVPASSGLEIDTGLLTVAPRCIVAIPILFRDRLLGVIVLGSMKPLGDLDKEILNNSVPQIGVAITNALNYDETQKLSREIGKKNDELNTKNTELETAYRVKSDFLSSMSHELRTPLNSIIGFTSILLSPNGDVLSEDQRMALNKVLRNSKHLLQLINDILDLSKIEAGRMSITIEPDTVENVVLNSVETVDALVKSKNLTVKQLIAPALPILRTDVLKVKQILVNLLSNAVKFTDQGEISVTVEQKNGIVYFKVKDSGIGIEEKNIPVIFQEFQQIDSSSTRKYKGTGLGLPISRRLARMLGGDLSVESTFGHGSTFALAVPAIFPEELRHSSDVIEMGETPKQAQPAFHVPAAKAEKKNVQILCIDDNQDVLDILRNYLIPEGYSVATALSGEEGIEAARKVKPDLITLDIMMPQKDGWQVLRELKQDPATKEIPVIIHSTIDNKPLALSLGALDVLPKPVEPKFLLGLVERVCEADGKDVLIVDDSEDFCSFLKSLLEEEGFNVTTAYNGAEALDLLKVSIPSLIVLDLIMPVMDGFQFIQEVEKNERWRDIPVIILSAKDLDKQDRETLNKHIVDYMHKSDFSREGLSKIVAKVLSHHKN